MIKLDFFNGKLRTAGLTLSLIYYPYDLTRCHKTYAITLKAENSWFTIGITPNNPEKFFKLLKYLMAHAKDNKELPQDNEKDCLKNEKEKKIN